jgi:hypothetical protein
MVHEDFRQSKIGTYSRRGALATLTFGLVVMGVTGVLVYLAAPETLRCERNAAGQPVCTLERRVMGLPLREQDLGVVQAAKVSESKRESSRSNTRNNYSPSFWLLIYTERGMVDTVQSRDYSASQKVQGQLQAFVTDRQAPAFDATLPGTPRTLRYALIGFAVGAAIPLLWVLGYFFPWMRPPVPASAHRHQR